MASVFAVAIYFVNFVKRPVITNTNWFPCFNFARGPSMSMPTYSSGPSRKTALTVVGAFRMYRFECKIGSPARLCRRRWPYRPVELLSHGVVLAPYGPRNMSKTTICRWKRLQPTAKRFFNLLKSSSWCSDTNKEAYTATLLNPSRAYKPLSF